MAPPEGGSENTIIDQEANSEFRWGVKRGRGAKGKDIQFYDSFTYGGVEYSCYDCVYLHKEGEPEPYIGKIIKIWEDRKFKKNRIKLVWFFRPIEIRNWLDDHCPDDKEIFLASGEGKGVFNINLLEVIVGKCKVICTSTDPRNPKPSEEDLHIADYFYNRTFDVGKLMVSESFAGIEAEVAFNKQAYFGSNEFRANKSMANGSLFLEDGAKPGISGELSKSKRKLDKITNEEELKKDMISKKRPNNNETQKEKNMSLKEEVQRNATRKEDPKEELKGNEIPNEELKKIETAMDDLKNEAAKEEIKKNESMKVELKKNETAKEETEKNASPNDQRKKSETANEELIAEPEITLKVSSNLDSPIQFPRLEVKASEKKINKNEPSKEEKKPIKRARVMVDSDEEADGMTGFQMDESENAPRKTTASKKELSAPENKVVKKAKLGDNSNKTSEEMAKTTSQVMELSKEKKLGREVIEITRRPEVESNKWFKGLPWDERLQKGFEQRAVIRLQNFDPSYTSSEIDDVMWHMFEERCTARVMPRTMFSNPKSGDALVIFKTKEAAEVALRKLNQACLTFSDGRSFIATRAAPVTSGKQKYAGHISVEKHKLLMQRAHQSEDMRKAVSTSHCSQPNTIEYEMAMEWRLLQEKSERWWNGLYKQEASEVNKVEHKNPISKKKN